jgi:ABC-type transporter Mla subunit MlaD
MTESKTRETAAAMAALAKAADDHTTCVVDAISDIRRALGVFADVESRLPAADQALLGEHLRQIEQSLSRATDTLGETGAAFRTAADAVKRTGGDSNPNSRRMPGGIHP